MAEKKMLLGLMGVLALFAGVWIGSSYYADDYKVEHLQYEVIGKIDDGQKNLETNVPHFAEIRKYPSYIMAQVVVKDTTIEKAGS